MKFTSTFVALALVAVSGFVRASPVPDVYDTDLDAREFMDSQLSEVWERYYVDEIDARDLFEDSLEYDARDLVDELEDLLARAPTGELLKMAARFGRKKLQDQAVQHVQAEMNKRPAGSPALAAMANINNNKAKPAGRIAPLKVDLPTLKRPESKSSAKWKQAYKADVDKYFMPSLFFRDGYRQCPFVVPSRDSEIQHVV
ncbi:hypothetical protein MD484_g8969, partial [Candolleomyces efflorescens]